MPRPAYYECSPSGRALFAALPGVAPNSYSLPAPPCSTQQTSKVFDGRLRNSASLAPVAHAKGCAQALPLL